MLNDIIKTVDNHNLYLNHLSRNKVENIAKNHSMYYMYKISEDPINLILSQSSVDAMTGPAKKIGNGEAGIESPGANVVLTRTPGNAHNKAESIIENLVGKEAIGICATGMKAFFGLTAYVNKMMNEGTKEDRLMIHLDHNEGIIIDGIAYHLLANINATDAIVYQLDKVINSNPNNTQLVSRYNTLKSQLKSAKDLDDAALTLSAMLSLATDNAKELLLSKLNAGTKTIGMYLYGISIGVPFKTIAKILMSNVGTTITELMEGNIFNGAQGVMSLNDAFNYLEIGPKSGLRKFKQKENYNHPSPLESMNSQFRRMLNYDVNINPANNIARLAWDDSLTLSEKFDIIDKMNYVGELKFQYLFGLLLEFVKHYLSLVQIVKDNMDVYENIKTLSEGAQEMRVMGSMFSLNQGLKSKPDEFMSKVSDFTSCISDRKNFKSSQKNREMWQKYYKGIGRIEKEEKEKLNRFKLLQFITNPIYRNQTIAQYDKVKHTFNILDAITKVPHFEGYFLTLAVADACDLYSSPKFKFSYELGNKWIDDLNITTSKDKNRVFKGLQLYYSDYVRQRWMLDSGLTITIPAGCLIITEDGQLVPTTGPTPIKLGTRAGDATFKMFMEKRVIPNAQNGKYGSIIESNRFILGLKPAILTNTVSHNPILYYTLPINMMPHSDTELVIFDRYKAAFNDLTVSAPKVGGFPITDLFYYYTLIAHYGKQGLLSLMPIFLNLHNDAQLRAFHTYEALFDEEVPEEGSKEYVVPVGDPNTSYTKYIYAKNAEGKMVLFERMTFDGESGYYTTKNQIIENEDINNYVMYGTLTDLTNKKYPIPVGNQSYDITVNGNRIVKVEGPSNNITELFLQRLNEIANSNNPSGLKPNLIPKWKRNGLSVINTQLIQNLINKIINCG